MSFETLVFERGDYLYLVGAVAPITPSEEELAALEFGEQLRSSATNENLLWLRGQYVEADTPNRNGQMWSAKELAIKHLTPRFMPVTVMHDARTAVGLIADTRLLTPDQSDVPRARIDTVLAVWSHRFPEVAEEIAANYKQGSLMQSMECSIGHYECATCGKGYVKLPQNAERANWCDHLRESATPVRRLVDVTFNGTGLIFGTRQGATGALPTAHLELAEEVAEFHERAKADKSRRPRQTMDEITIKRNEYDDLKAEAAKVEGLAKQVSDLTASATRVPDLESQVEALEIDKKKFEDEAAAERDKREKLEEKANASELARERVSKLGAEFVAKLPESVRTRLQEQARKMSDEKWSDRLDELAALTGVKSGEGTPVSPTESGEFTSEETARTALGGGQPRTEPSSVARSSVIGGLLRSVRPEAPAQPKK